MNIYTTDRFSDFNCPECGIGLECDDVAVGVDEIVCPECNTELLLARKIKYTVRIV